MARDIQKEIGQLARLRDGDPKAAAAALRRALGDRVNLVVAKAAKLGGEMELRELAPDLLRAFERMLDGGAATDPQCWAKNAIAQALVDLGHRESAAYLRASRYVQMEAVYGGREDTATTLRGICLLALVACTDIPRERLFRALVDALVERPQNVRVDAVRAIARMEGDEAALLLRLKARVGDEELAVAGQVFESILQIEGESGVEFVAEFLQSGAEGVREEAALSMGASRLPGALATLRSEWTASRDPGVRYILLRALGASRQEEALAFLLDLVRKARAQDATDALEALSLHAQSPDIRERTERAVEERGSDLRERFARLFPRI